MKKKLTILLATIFILIAGVILARNFIVKKIIEIKLTELNKGKVDVKKVEFSPLDKKIVVIGIDVTSRKNTLKNLISIDKFEADYDIYFKDKKILISKADFTGINFMTNRAKDGGLSHIVRDEESKVVETEKTTEDKNTTIKKLEELIAVRANISKEMLQESLKANYEDIGQEINNKKEYWKTRIKTLENTQDYKTVKNLYTQIVNEKNPIKLLRMEKNIKIGLNSFKRLSKELLKDRKEMINDFKNITIDKDIDNLLKNNVKNIIGKGELIVLDLDSIVNFYLNEIYKENVNEFVERYRTIMKELELRRDEDLKEKDKWEVFIESIGLKTELYGLNLEGEINHISSRISKNLDDTEFQLRAVSDNTLGEVKGILNIRRLRGDIKIDISKIDFSDIKNLEILNRYVLAGEARLDKDITLTRDNIYLDGEVEIQKMKLNSQLITNELKINNTFLKDMMLPLLNEINVGIIEYDYNSETGKLKVKSNLSKEIMKVLNSDKGEIRKKLMQDMMKQGKESIEKYTKILSQENEESLNDLQNIFNTQIEYLDKVQEILDKFNIKINNKTANNIINKLFN